MKAGDLVIVLYEAKKLYIVLGQCHSTRAHGEQYYELYNIATGKTRHTPYSEIKVISEG